MEGFVLRLAQHDDAEDLVLRGGMRISQAVPGRTPSDVDLVCRTTHFLGVVPWFRRVASTVLRDDVHIDGDRFRVDDVIVRGERMGARIVAAGRVGTTGADFSVDLHRALPLGPEPIRRPFAAARGQAKVWMCEPATLVGRKVRVTAELGRRGWRPKDLVDLVNLSRRLGDRPSERDALAAGLHAALHGTSHWDVAREAFGSASWWTERLAMRRWRSWAPANQRNRLRALVDPVIAAVADVLRGTT